MCCLLTSFLLFYGVRDSLRLIVRWLFLLCLYAAKISLSYCWFVGLFTLTDNGLGLKAGGHLKTTSLSTTTKVDKKHQNLITYKRPLDFSPCYPTYIISVGQSEGWKIAYSLVSFDL